MKTLKILASLSLHPWLASTENQRTFYSPDRQRRMVSIDRIGYDGELCSSLALLKFVNVKLTC